MKSAQLLQWLVFSFFRQTTELALYVSLFVHYALLLKYLLPDFENVQRLSARHEKKSNRVSNRIEILKNRIESKFCESKFDPESIFKIKK